MRAIASLASARLTKAADAIQDKALESPNATEVDLAVFNFGHALRVFADALARLGGIG